LILTKHEEVRKIKGIKGKLRRKGKMEGNNIPDSADLRS